MNSLCEIILYSGEFFVCDNPVLWRVLCVRWPCILASSLCDVVMYSGEFYVEVVLCSGEFFM